jgi:endonuclease/exonuclease/phosphatase family metal-dependent hydrolase
MLGISIFAIWAGQYDPSANEFAAYVAFGKLFIVAINLVLLVYWLIRFRCWVWVPVIALAANYQFILAMFNPLPHSGGYAGPELRVLTYNVHYFGGEITGFSAKEFKEIMDEKKIDVACFQEYVGNGDFTYEDLHNTYSPLFPYVFQSKEDMSKVIYSRYPILQAKLIKFPKTNNGAVWADIDVNGRTVRVINVHMQTTTINRMKRDIGKAQAAHDEEREQMLYMTFKDNLMHNLVTRSRQARAVAHLVDTTSCPVVLCGDFNDTPGTFTYEKLKGRLEDGFMKAGHGYGATFKEFYNLMRIDYIFHSPELQAVDYKTIPFEMSDHNPVYMEVGL